REPTGSPGGREGWVFARPWARRGPCGASTGVGASSAAVRPADGSRDEAAVGGVGGAKQWWASWQGGGADWGASEHGGGAGRSAAGRGPEWGRGAHLKRLSSDVKLSFR